MVRNGIPTVCFYFCSMERNSDLFFLPRKGSEPNSESMLVFLFHVTEFCVFFSSAEGFGREFREVSVPRNSQNSVGHDHLFRLFRLPRNYFLSEIPKPSHYYLLLVFPSVLMSLLLLVYPAVPVFSCAAVGQSGNVFLLLLFFH
jgi:hypothetical protein